MNIPWLDRIRKWFLGSRNTANHYKRGGLVPSVVEDAAGQTPYNSDELVRLYDQCLQYFGEEAEDHFAEIIQTALRQGITLNKALERGRKKAGK
jgi:hypothetical protein